MFNPPFKWAGGKSKVISQYLQYIPKQINDYYEPFVGGGALFFFLQKNNLIRGTAHLYDINEELINAYKAIRDNIHDLVIQLIDMQRRHSHEYYYEVRNWDRDIIKIDDITRAARTLYLNKTCYNGLYRVNSNGHFNVPIGRYKNPQIVNRENLIEASRLLQDVEIKQQSYLDLRKITRKKAFVYFDPPYFPISTTSNFTNYTQSGFSTQDQINLKDLFDHLSANGIKVMESNSGTPFIKQIYGKYHISEIYVNRAINSDSSKRKKITEFLITNYQKI